MRQSLRQGASHGPRISPVLSERHIDMAAGRWDFGQQWRIVRIDIDRWNSPAADRDDVGWNIILLGKRRGIEMNLVVAGMGAFLAAHVGQFEPSVGVGGAQRAAAGSMDSERIRSMFLSPCGMKGRGHPASGQPPRDEISSATGLPQMVEFLDEKPALPTPFLVAELAELVAVSRKRHD